jgi:histidine triad (HIT) family protein
VTSNGNIEVPDDENCAFCAYLQGDRPYTILFRSELVATLVTREQRGVSHLLVIPTRHCQTILDLTDEESTAVMNEIRRSARIIDLADQRPGIAIWQNNGIPANQTIGHLHFHVAGTLEDGGTDWGNVPELSVADTESIAEKLRHADSIRPNSRSGDRDRYAAER